MKKEIILVIPEFNRKGGTQRVMLELVKHLSHHFHFTVLSGSFERKESKKVRWIKIPYIKRLQILKFLSFFITSHLFLIYCWLTNKQKFLVWSTGADCVKAHLLTMHDCSRKRMYMALKDLKQNLWSLHRWNSFLYHSLTAFFEKIALRNAMKVVAVSENLKRDILKFYPWIEGKINIIYNGVNTDEFSPENRRFKAEILKLVKVEEKRKVLIFVGGEWDRKNLETVLKIHSHLSEDFHLIVIGKGKKKWLENQLRKYGIENRTSYIPFTDKIPLFIASADVLLLLSEHEPFGLPAIEAMASGIPVIVSDRCGVSEIVEDKKDGFVVPLN